MDRFFFKDYFYFLFMSVYVCVLVPIGSLGTGITGSCELLSLGDGNRTSILCKNSKYP